jgi:hypothetical protein
MSPIQPRSVTGADAVSIVFMKVLIEQQIVAPIGVLLEFFGSAEHQSSARLITQKDANQLIRNLARDLEPRLEGMVQPYICQ